MFLYVFFENPKNATFYVFLKWHFKKRKNVIQKFEVSEPYAFPDFSLYGNQSMWAEREQSGKRSGAGQKSGWAERSVSWGPRSGNGAGSGLNPPLQRPLRQIFCCSVWVFTWHKLNIIIFKHSIAIHIQ